MNNAAREKRMKDLIRNNRLREEELIRQHNKRIAEINRNAQKRQIEIIRDTQRRKQEILRKNLEREKREEERMRENLNRQRQRQNIILSNILQINNNNNNINRIQRRSVDTGQRNRQMLANILRAENLRNNNNIRNNINMRQSDQDIINEYAENLIRNINNMNINNNESGNENHNIQRIRHNDRKKVEELLQETEITEQILNKLDNKQCLICLDNYEIGEKISYLPCFHFFHFLCIKSWVQRSDKCPLCKNVIKIE